MQQTDLLCVFHFVRISRTADLVGDSSQLLRLRHDHNCPVLSTRKTGMTVVRHIKIVVISHARKRQMRIAENWKSHGIFDLSQIPIFPPVNDVDEG